MSGKRTSFLAALYGSARFLRDLITKPRMTSIAITANATGRTHDGNSKSGSKSIATTTTTTMAPAQSRMEFLVSSLILLLFS